MSDSFNRIQKAFLFILLGASTIAFITLLSNFFTPILWALAFAVVFYPLYVDAKQRQHSSHSFVS
jgi:predicted PurR-regulated permease PerM